MSGSVNIYIRATALTDVVGRIDYISNPERQENLMATSSTIANPDYWRLLAADSQAAWRQSGSSNRKHKEKQVDGDGRLQTVLIDNKCCEAREFHGALPNCALECDMNELAEKINQFVHEKTGADCTTAIHLNKKKNNLHYHTVFSERQKLPEPIIRIADRNAFIDENGVRKRTKKEILDENGDLRPGCKIVKKGEVLYTWHFSEKEPILSSKEFLRAFKGEMAQWINQELDPDKKRVVFNPNGPYLAQQHVGKGLSEDTKAAIEEYNHMVRQYNRFVDYQLDHGCKEGQLQTYKTMVMLSPNRNETLNEFFGCQPITCSQRTVVDNNEADKQKLRQLYRESRIKWNKINETHDTISRKILIAEARKISAQIDELRRRLGYMKEEEMIRKEVEEMERHRRYMYQALHNRKWQYYLENRAARVAESIKDIEKKIADMKRFGHYDTVELARLKRERKRLWAEHEELVKEAKQAKLDRMMAKMEIKELRMAKKHEREIREAILEQCRDQKVWHFSRPNNDRI